jgi:hypothetical protein
MVQNPEEKGALRTRFLKMLYEETEGDRFKSVYPAYIAKGLEIHDDEAQSVAQYLVDEGLANWASLAGDLEITQGGLKVAEREIIQERQDIRDAVLAHAYQASGGDPNEHVDYREVASKLFLMEQEVTSAITYLADRGLAKWQTNVWFGITAQGVDAVESLGQVADAAPAVANVVQVTGDIHGFALQQASPGASLQQVVQVMGSDDIEAVKLLTDAYRQLMENTDAEAELVAEAEAELKTLDAQVGSPKPKRAVVTESLRTLRSLVENFAAGAALQAVLHHFSALGM